MNTPDITTEITAFIEKHRLLPASGSVLVAVSGGADSLCLLHVLNCLCGPGKRYPDVQLSAAHLNHQLRSATSDQEAAAVAALVESWNIPITVCSIDVPALAHAEHRSLEDAARTARYRFLRQVAQGRSIAVAHHADDQIETLLLHFLRGSGLAGLVGMQPRQQDIIRPLLEITHAQTVSYCRQHAITPLEDLSNSDPRFTRNRIRHQLLPLLESINPGLRATLLRNANVLLSDLDYIETQVDACWPAVILSEQDDIITLSIPALLNLHESLQHHLLRSVAAQLCNGQSPLELRHYALLDELLHRPATQEEHTLHLPSGLRASRVYSTLTLRRVSQPAPPVGTRFIASTPPATGRDSSNVGTRFIASTSSATNTYYDESGGAGRDESRPYHSLSIPGNVSGDTGRDEAHPYNSLSIPGEVDIPGTPWRAKAEYLPSDIEQQVIEALQHGNWQDVWRLLPPSRYVVYINAQVAGSLLRVRVRRPGDRMQPLGMRHEKKVQDILVDAHIPRGERDTLPLFFSDTHCLWLAGVCIDERAKLTSQTRRIVRLSIEPARS